MHCYFELERDKLLVGTDNPAYHIKCTEIMYYKDSVTIY